jgi:hypothetical protein
MFARQPDGTLARHAAQLRRHEGRASPGSTAASSAIRHDGRSGGFWQGYRLRLLDAAGQAVSEARIAEFSRAAGTLRVERPWK